MREKLTITSTSYRLCVSRLCAVSSVLMMTVVVRDVCVSSGTPKAIASSLALTFCRT
jgi:hypothetical protein